MFPNVPSLSQGPADWLRLVLCMRARKPGTKRVCLVTTPWRSKYIKVIYTLKYFIRPGN